MQQRLTLLKDAGVISQVAHDGTIKAVDLLVTEWQLDTSTEQLQMAMTHLARAVDRILSDQPIEQGLDEDILAEIMNDNEFPVIQAINNKVLDVFGIEQAPDTENTFFLSNLFSLYCAK
ncbi:hypothetical protein ACQKP8_25495 [Photobacterium alginatilyticum]|uniref:hypothetical protein n=1 Tax=Photobacterium alginatilyticum TaxID=1775171 RepID=UPI0040689F7A